MATETIERNEVFELAYRFVTETAENIFLTGKAGTGKTTFLKYLKEHCTKNTIVAAPTGVAAINAGGVTLHSLFQLPFHPFIPSSGGKDDLLGKMKYNKQRIQLLRKMELLVIDEISMVRCDTMDAIDTLLKSVRRNYHVPFGGVQLLCIGDLHQLPPVAQNQEWSILQEYYASPFFFDSMAVKEQQPILIELNKIYRQKEQSFVELLNNVRTNNMAAEDFEMLHERFIPGFRPGYDEKFITLTSHNKQAELINNSEIQKLLSPAFTYQAEIEHEFPEHIFPADPSLMLKQGAQVMFIKNDVVEKKYFNGKIGVVARLDNDKIVVDCAGVEIEVYKETWENSRYTLNRADSKLQQEVIGTFTQYPLRLAWAITIHKSQGLTFEKVMIDAGAAFSSGQVYVALSRCTSLGGIVLLSKIPTSAIYSNDNVVKGQSSLTHKGSLAERFEGARQMFTQQLLEDIFAFNTIESELNSLQYHINEQNQKLNNGAVEWMTKLQESFRAEKMNGLKFIRQINTLLKEQPVVEDNDGLQTRIAAAANHFIPKLKTLLEELKNQPLITEHKETADLINEYFNTAAIAIFETNYYLEFCKTQFSLLSFLKYKIDFAQPKFNISCYASGKKSSTKDSPNPELYDTIKRWRDMVCEDEGTPIFMVATHLMMKDIATFLPRTSRDLLLISGFGKAKVDKYGEDILQTVNDYCELHNIESNMAAKAASPKRERKTKPVTDKIDTKESTYSLFKEGKTIAEIAVMRNLTIQTIEGHIAAFIEKGMVEITSLISQDKYEEVAKIMKDRGEKTLTDLKPLLPNASFGEMRMVEAALKANAVID
jgi:DNA-binding CsgD family transcriptional regulator